MASQPVSMEIELYKLEWKSFGGKIHDLASEFLELQITESVGEPFRKGFVKFQDLNGISEFLDGYSGGTLTIRFRTNKNFEFYEEEFFVYKAGADHSSERTHQYNRRTFVFYFCSEEMSSELFEKYSVYYEDKKPHEIVELVLKNMLGGATLFKVDNTKDKLNLVTHYGWSPLDIVSYCIKQSFSESNQDVGYVFFENKDGYHYVSLSELLKQPHTYEFHLDVTDEGDGTRQKYAGSTVRVHNYKTMRYVDYVESFMNHRFGGSVHYVDLEDIRMQEIKHKFDESYLSTTVNLGTKTFSPTLFSNDKAFHYPSNWGSDTTGYELPLMSRYDLMNESMMVATFSGDSRFKAGIIVRIEYLSKERGNFNERLHGNWIIWGCTHRIIQKEGARKYMTEVHLRKDAVLSHTGPVFNTVKNNP